MDRESFREIINYLIDRFNPRSTFELDDYYDQVKYIPNDLIKDLRKKIIESCEYFPKPAELKKIAQEFKLPYTKPLDVRINYDNCIIHQDKPVYKSIEDPYYCKECHEEKKKNRERQHEQYKDMGFPVDQWNTKETPLKAILERSQKEYSTKLF